MEVHHHPKVEKKNFKEYFLEFLMIFLAVTMGFFAEQIREGFAERGKEKDYMHSLVEDLQADTSHLNHGILFGKGISDKIEKLISILNNDPLPKDSIEKLYLINHKARRVVRVDFEDRTSSQLINAGNMRLILNKQVADSIRNYWAIIKTADNISERLENLRGKAADLDAKLFNSRYLKYSNIEDPLQSDFSILQGAKLISDDPKLLAEYANRQQSTQIVLNNYLIYLNIAREVAQNLITLIKTKYDI